MDKKALIKALRDTVQSASNSVAGGVSAPIDLIAAGLRKVGLPIPQAPVGGSQWMENMGLTVPVEEGIPKMAGDFLGMIVPTAATAKAPQIAAAANRGLENLAAPRTLNTPGYGGQRGAVGFVYPQQEALDIAQRNAAKPVSEGGLGLPPNNTAMDRAKAMGYPMDLYTSRHSPIGYVNKLPKPNTPIKNAEKIKAELEQLGIPVRGEQSGTGSTYLSFPGNPYKIDPAYGGGTSVPIEQMRFSTHSKRADKIPINQPDDQFVADVFPKYGNSLNEARSAIQSMIEKGGIRSRFAAFDPARINESDLLGYADPRLLGLLGLGTAGGIGAYNYMQGK